MIHRAPGNRTKVPAAAAAVVCALSLASRADDPGQVASLAIAERFVTAFYSFDPARLKAILGKAADSREDILFYQAWALGGNYVVKERMPCASVTDDVIDCRITVRDDLVLALGIDFDVTDTFSLTFSKGAIVAVETSSNDPQLYHDASDWVWENHPSWVEAPCRGGSATKPDPGLCVSNMLKGYREYARINELEPRAAEGPEQ